MPTINKRLKELDQKKKILDRHRPLSPEAIKNLENWLDVELTYTSNAIEGNTLTRLETALVIEKGITVKGKSLAEHLEAVNHKEALDYIKNLVQKNPKTLTPFHIKSLHRLILGGINDRWAGRYRQIKVPQLMENFTSWLQKQENKHPVKTAGLAHFKLVSIHPFIDGNGRTARLLMNLILIKNGYPMAIIRKQDRNSYLKSLQRGQLEGKKDSFHHLIIDAVDRSLDIYLDTIGKKQKETKSLLKIGRFAQKAGVSIHTVRFYIKQGFLNPVSKTRGGLTLYDKQNVKTIKEIKRLQESERLTLLEIKKRLGF